MDKELRTDLTRIFEVRDGFAHKLDEKDTRYRQKPIEALFSEFIKDLQNTWNKLIVEYNKIMKDYDFHFLIR